MTPWIVFAVCVLLVVGGLGFLLVVGGGQLRADEKERSARLNRARVANRPMWGGQ